MKKGHLIRETSQALGINRIFLLISIVRCQRTRDTDDNELWEFLGRLPQKYNLIIEALRSLIEEFWKNNTRVYLNQIDEVRRRFGS